MSYGNKRNYCIENQRICHRVNPTIMRSNEIIRQQCDAAIRIAESIALSIEQDKECRKIITEEYISHINRLAAERDSLIREVEKLTKMLSYMQGIICNNIKPTNNINIK